METYNLSYDCEMESVKVHILFLYIDWNIIAQYVSFNKYAIIKYEQ